MHRRCYALVAFALAVSCKSKGEQPAPATQPGSAAGSQVAPPTPGQTQLFVGDKSVATVDLAKVASWPRVDALVPPDAARLGMWQSIKIKGSKPTPSEINKPSEAYRDYVPALFPGPGGGISFGMFDPVELGKKGQPALREDGVVELRVILAEGTGRGENDHQGGGAAVDPTQLKLTIKTAKGETVITGDKLLEIPRESVPGGGGEGKGWKLVTVLEAAGVKTFNKVVLSGANNVSVPIEKKELDAKTIPFIKLNRQGSLRFRVFKQQGDAWQATGDLRELNHIDVVK